MRLQKRIACIHFGWLVDLLCSESHYYLRELSPITMNSRLPDSQPLEVQVLRMKFPTLAPEPQLVATQNVDQESERVREELLSVAHYAEHMVD